MQRGYRNRFFYVKTNESKSDAIIMELWMEKKGAEWYY